MSRVLTDASGSHLLTAVVAVTPLNRPRSRRTGEPGAQHAVLHFSGGGTIVTRTAYADALKAWSAIVAPTQGDA